MILPHTAGGWLPYTTETLSRTASPPEAPERLVLGCTANPHAYWSQSFLGVNWFLPPTCQSGSVTLDFRGGSLVANTIEDCLCVVAPWLAMSQPFGLRTTLGVPQQSPCVLVPVFPGCHLVLCANGSRGSHAAITHNALGPDSNNWPDSTTSAVAQRWMENSSPSFRGVTAAVSSATPGVEDSRDLSVSASVASSGELPGLDLSLHQQTDRKRSLQHQHG